MNCWHCNSELIWGGDQDVELDEPNEHALVTNLSCPTCPAMVDVWLPWTDDDEQPVLN